METIKGKCVEMAKLFEEYDLGINVTKKYVEFSILRAMVIMQKYGEVKRMTPLNFKRLLKKT